jgi:uncharacterized protein (DUF3820 family)
MNTGHTLYFGKYKNRPLPEVPGDYLAWALRTLRLTARRPRSRRRP